MIYASTILIKSLSQLSKVFKVSHFAVSFMIMALATSIPELFLGVNSALDRVPTLSLGTVIGSNIADLALVFGVILLLVPSVKLKSVIAKKDALYMTAIVFLPLFLLVDKTLSRIDGVILLFVFAFYSWSVFWSKQKFFKLPQRIEKGELKKAFNLFKELLIFIVGVLVLVVASRFVVGYSEELAISLGLPLVVVGISVLALSTSLPELVFEIRAVATDRRSMALGDLIGSLVVNSGLVLGVTALICPIQIESLASFFLGAGFLIFFLLFFVFSVFRGVPRFSGALLILFYLVFLVLEFVK